MKTYKSESVLCLMSCSQWLHMTNHWFRSFSGHEWATWMSFGRDIETIENSNRDHQISIGPMAMFRYKTLYGTWVRANGDKTIMCESRHLPFRILYGFQETSRGRSGPRWALQKCSLSLLKFQFFSCRKSIVWMQSRCIFSSAFLECLFNL